jgi:redox-sensitive bicupin YhaK (pirin superfamily)
MSIRIIRKNQQAVGQFNGGEILENKPIGFPREGGDLKPYSNLFYWAHAWSDEGSTIGLHPHQGFEIMSFVIEGSIEHFDTKLNKWISLEKGAAQIIRAGNGISHSEKINAGGHMFQVWFDPNLDKTLQQEASYNDYSIDEFPFEKSNGIKKLTYKGEGSPLLMDSPGIEILSFGLDSGNRKLELDESKIYSAYLVKGNVKLDGQELEANDYFIIQDSNELKIDSKGDSMLFVIASPKKIDYYTYAQRMMQ